MIMKLDSACGSYTLEAEQSGQLRWVRIIHGVSHRRTPSLQQGSCQPRIQTSDFLGVKVIVVF